MITLREVEERIERGDTPEAIREFLEEAARSGVEVGLARLEHLFSLDSLCIRQRE